MNEARVIPVRMPDSSMFHADVGGITYLLVQDLKYILYQQGVPVHPSRMKFAWKNRCLGEVDSVLEMDPTEADPIVLIVRVVDDLPLLLSYDEFIVSTYPKNSAINVSTQSPITITLKANQLGHCVYTPSLVFFEDLQTLIPNAPSTGKHFISLDQRERILLLQVEESLELRLEELLFDMAKLDVLCGDADSWQRYTSFPPVPCDLTVSPMSSAFPHEVVLRPLRPLLPNTFYAVVLCNNIPTVPVSQPEESWHYSSAAIGADKVIVFRTERPQGEKMGRLTAVRNTVRQTRSNSHVSVS